MQSFYQSFCVCAGSINSGLLHVSAVAVANRRRAPWRQGSAAALGAMLQREGPARRESQSHGDAELVPHPPHGHLVPWVRPNKGWGWDDACFPANLILGC